MKPLVPYFLQEEFLRKIRAAPSSSNEFRVSRNVIIKVTFVFVLSVYYLSWIFLHLRWRTTRLDRSEVNRPQRLTYPWLCRWEILLFVSESEREREWAILIILLAARPLSSWIGTLVWHFLAIDTIYGLQGTFINIPALFKEEVQGWLRSSFVNKIYNN